MPTTTSPSVRMAQLFGELDPTERLVWSTFAECWGTGKDAECKDMLSRFQWRNRNAAGELLKIFLQDAPAQWFDPSDDAPEVILADPTEADEINPSGVKVQINDYRIEMTAGQAERLGDRLTLAAKIAKGRNKPYGHEAD